MEMNIGADMLLVLGAGVFFVFKFVTGFFIHNLSLELLLTRGPSAADGTDYLAVELKLVKGNMSSITLHDIQYSVTAGDDRRTIVQPGISRLETVEAFCGDTSRFQVVWKNQASSNPLNTLGPGEKTSFSVFCEVPAGIPATVEAIVLGRRSFVGVVNSQWRTSKISISNPKTSA